MVIICEVQSEQEIYTVRKLANIIWNEHYTPIIGRKQVEYMLSCFQSIYAINEQISEGYKYFLILFEEVPVGYFAVLPDFESKSMFLSKIYVKKEYRGRGFARICIDYMQQMCVKAGLEFIWLTVNKNNADSIMAYEKLGFKNTGEITQDIGNGFVMDDYRMEKQML